MTGELEAIQSQVLSLSGEINQIQLIGFWVTLLTIIITAVINHFNNKRLNNYTLYNQKRHEIYPKIYQLLIRVQNNIEIVQIKLIFNINSQSLSQNEIELLLGKLKIKDKNKDKILNLYNDSDYHWADLEIVSSTEKSQHTTYNLSVNDLNEYFLENECYLSKSLGDQLREVIKELYNLKSKHSSCAMYNRAEMWSQYLDKVDSLSQEIDLSSNDIIRKIMNINNMIKKQIEST